MQALLIPKGAWVFVGDGHKALFLRNDGTASAPRFVTIRVFENPETDPTHIQGTDRPGRVFDRATAKRSTVAQPDWHRLAKERFTREVVAALERLAGRERIRRLYLVAPPPALAALRAALPETLKPLVAAEIDKDLTNHPVGEIGRLLTGG